MSEDLLRLIEEQSAKLDAFAEKLVKEETETRLALIPLCTLMGQILARTCSYAADFPVVLEQHLTFLDGSASDLYKSASDNGEEIPKMTSIYVEAVRTSAEQARDALLESRNQRARGYEA